MMTISNHVHTWECLASTHQDNHLISCKYTEKTREQFYIKLRLLTLCKLCNFLCFCYGPLTFSKLTFFKKLFQKPFKSKSLDPDKDQRSVGPGLGPNCLQRLSADNKSPLARKE